MSPDASEQGCSVAASADDDNRKNRQFEMGVATEASESSEPDCAFGAGCDAEPAGMALIRLCHKRLFAPMHSDFEAHEKWQRSTLVSR